VGGGSRCCAVRVCVFAVIFISATACGYQQSASEGDTPNNANAGGDIARALTNKCVEIHDIVHLAQSEQWLINLHDIEIGHLVSTNDMFEVCTGKIFQSTQVAVKTMTVGEDQASMRALYQTLRSLARLRQPTLSLFLGIAVDLQFEVPRVVLIHELQLGPHLDVYLQDKPLQAPCNFTLALELGKSVHYLHSQSPPILLPNLTPAHIIVTGPTKHPKAKIISYGLHVLHEVVHKERESGTVVQIAQQNAPPSSDAEMDSFGSILLLLMSRVRTPGEIESAIHTMTEQLADQATARIELIRACFNCDLAKRPSMLEIVRFLENEIAVLQM